MIRKAIKKYNYWKKTGRNVWTHIPTGDKLEILKEQSFRHYYLMYHKEGSFFDYDLGGAMTRGDMVLEAHNFLASHDIEKIIYNKIQTY